jgi:hypothetical protein
VNIKITVLKNTRMKAAGSLETSVPIYRTNIITNIMMKIKVENFVVYHNHII